MIDVLTDEVLDKAALKELRKARQRSTIQSLVGTSAVMNHESREQEIKSITETYITALKGSLTSLSSGLEGSLKGQVGKKAKEALQQQVTNIQSLS